MSERALQLGRTFLTAGNYAAAIEAAEEVLGEAPENDEAWALLHRAVEHQSGKKEALKIAEKWISIMPESRGALLCLAVDIIALRKVKHRIKELPASYVSH